MNSEIFLKIAKDTLSNNPMDRMNPMLKKAILDPNVIMDLHIHSFDKNCLNVGYVLLRFAKSMIGAAIGLEKFVPQDEIINNIDKEQVVYDNIISVKDSKTDNDWEELENYLEELNDAKNLESIGIFGYDLKQIIKILKKGSIQDVYKYYIDNFSIKRLDEFKSNPFITGILMMDLESGWSTMDPKTKLYEQIGIFKAIASKNPVVNFLAVDPRRAELPNSKNNLFELFLEAFTGDEKYFGVKCYPSLGYLPNDNRLDPIFAICSEKNIPITTHCGAETVSTYEKKFVFQNSDGLNIDFQIPGDTRKDRAKYLNDPERWFSVLEKYPNLRINFAHFGGDTNWENNSNFDNKIIIKIIDLMKKYNYVYTDFSFNVAESQLFNTLEGVLKRETIVKDRLLFGTDYWVVLPKGNLFENESLFLNQLSGYKTKMLRENPKRFLLGDFVNHDI